MTERETAISQTARGLSFDDFVITEDGDELLAQCEEEVFFLEPLALVGQLTMIYAPPNAGKTLIILSLARSFQCRSITSTPTTKTNAPSQLSKSF